MRCSRGWPSGAGKSSIVRAVVGLTRIAAGAITFDGRRIDGLASDRRAQLGLAYVPEGRRVFGALTVRDNLLMGGYLAGTQAPARLEQMFELFPRLAERRRQLAATLSGGEQQMLAIGRALMRGPRLLVLDEPSLGLSPIMAELVFERLVAIRDAGTTILLVEQNATSIELATHGLILQTGRVLLAGEAKTLADSDFVRRAYLGV